MMIILAIAAGAFAQDNAPGNRSGEEAPDLISALSARRFSADDWILPKLYARQYGNWPQENAIVTATPENE